MSPEVSVIIPTWNRAATIAAAITSALNQTHRPLEVLICDDGSTDNTREIVESFNDERVRWLSGPHAGRPAVPRNRGIREARGQWLAFLDSDDQWEPKKLSEQLDVTHRIGCHAACTNALRLVSGEGIRGNLLSWEQRRVTFANLMDCNQVICSSAIIHRSLFELVDGFPEGPQLKALEDYALWLRVTTQTDFAYLDEPLVIYRDDPASSLRKDDPDVLTQREIVFNNFLEWANKQKRRDRSLGVYRTKVKKQRRSDLRQRRNDAKQTWRDSWRARRNDLMIVGGKVRRLLFK
jgi:glycosyltransferase involved in cell wall biosynthesis